MVKTLLLLWQVEVCSYPLLLKPETPGGAWLLSDTPPSGGLATERLRSFSVGPRTAFPVDRAAGPEVRFEDMALPGVLSVRFINSHQLTPLAARQQCVREQAAEENNGAEPASTGLASGHLLACGSDFSFERLLALSSPGLTSRIPQELRRLDTKLRKCPMLTAGGSEERPEAPLDGK
ncbi:hypothetical protein CB1_000294042 [Camelus ferus]|nr:hypothetical protein CB1_000294042 [Camelus ferus]